MRYHTKTGSIYETDDNNRVRKLAGGSGTKRVTEDWREYESISMEFDDRLLIVWGTGRDAVSDDLGTPEDCAWCIRTTLTSPVIKMEPS